MIVLMTVLSLLPSPSALAADVDYCSVYVSGNTRKATREIKTILAGKKYNIVSKREDAWNVVYSQREACGVPFGCGGSTYHIYFSNFLKSDPDYGPMITQDWQDHKRTNAIADMNARLANCPDAI